MSKLFLYTTSFPYSKGEQYIENELLFLLEEFDEIVFIPENCSGDARELPKRCHVKNIHEEVSWGFFNRIGYFIKALFFLFSNRACLREKTSTKDQIKKLYNAFAYKDVISKLGSSSDVHYSYWFYHWALILAMLKKDEKLDFAISRVHMGDVYDEIKITPFAGFKLKYLSQVYAISNHAKAYLLDKWPVFEHKISVKYLGVNSLNPIQKSDYIENKKLFVSCSTVRKAKRVDFIANVMSLLNEEVHWIHFGDGSDLKEVEKLCKQFPNNISYELKGFVPNREVLQFYQSYNVDLFINLSTQEGVPVSLMEAISFDIPVLGTDVYGTSEVVTEKSGLLVDSKLNADEMASQINNFIKSNIDLHPKRVWEDRFEAQKNYSKFAKMIKNKSLK